jgi:diaminopimelate decarboxylase/aspartate kinase
MKNITLKFGGSSMCHYGFNQIIEQIKKNEVEFDKIFIVVSAIKNTTNNLYKIINYEKNTYNDIVNDHYILLNQLSLEKNTINDILNSLNFDIDMFISNPLIDLVQQKIKIISYGEILSSTILYHYLKNNNIKIKFINARSIMKSKRNSSQIDVHTLYLKGPYYCDSDKLKFYIQDDINVYLTQGFILSTSDEKYAILTRSGSDTSASLVASAMNSERLEIWTDVNGMYTADPRIIKDAKLIKEINFDVCQELSASGSYVLHPFCIRPCQDKNIPIYIKNTLSDDNTQNTVVNSSKNKLENNVYAISVKKNINMFKIESLDMWEGEGFVSDIFSVFSKYGLSVDIITTSQFSITTTTSDNSNTKLESVKESLSKLYDVELIKNLNIISITTDNAIRNSKLQKSLILVKEKFNGSIYICHYSSNNLTLSLVVDNEICVELMNILHTDLI